MRLVRVKTVEQQDVQAMHRMREARVKERTALCNQTRGVLAEYGIVVAQGGVGALRRRNALSANMTETPGSFGITVGRWR